MDDILEEFLVESYENVDVLDQELVELEKAPTSSELLSSIFRNLHTLKGSGGFLGLQKLESLAHAAETLLSELRAERLTVTSEIMDALLAAVDGLRNMLDSLAAIGNDGDEAYPDLVASLHRLSSGESADGGAATGGDELGADGPAAAVEPVEPVEPVESVDAHGDPSVESVDAAVEPVESVDAHGDPSVESVDAADEPVEAAAAHAVEPADDPSVDHGAATGAGQVEPPTPAAAPGPSRGNDAPPTPAATSQHNVETSIRVDVGLLDRLMNLVGELVLARNQVLQHQATAADPSFHSTSQQLDLITTELQESVMKTRMQPIGNVWQKLPRVVRDLSNQCGKKVRLEMEGEDTELDKTLIEAIKDPLTHIVRNSVDHGIEEPAERVARGKGEVGTLKLRALHEGGQVVIEISDDGAGLNLDRIRDKAIANGIVTAERALRMTERETGMLIFEAGFSTAASVTNVSGRGVGMDVVRTNVEKIGGTIDLQSQPGEGMTLILKIPLTLAIIPALIVSCGLQRFLIPQINLVEVLHIVEGATEARIELAGDAKVLRLRGNLLPLVHLGDSIGVTDDVERGKDDDGATSVVVLQADGFKFGLIVDRINDTEEIVVKPLSAHLKHIDAYAGMTIMGDGAVSLILDVMGLARLGGVAGGNEEQEYVEIEQSDRERRGSTQMVLVCNVGDQRIGIPLALVARLESLDSSLVERANGREVIQYRGGLLELVRVAGAIGAMSFDTERDKLPVLVHESPAGLFGLVVDEIVDVFEAELDETGNAAESGVIGRRVTDLINIESLISMARPGAFAGAGY